MKETDMKRRTVVATPNGVLKLIDCKAWEVAKALGLPLSTQLAMYIYSMPDGCSQGNQQLADALGVTLKRLVKELSRMIQSGQIYRVRSIDGRLL